MADIFKKLDEEYQKRQPPKDTFSTMQYARHMNITRDKAYNFLRIMVRDGMLEYVGNYPPKNERYYRVVSDLEGEHE